MSCRAMGGMLPGWALFGGALLYSLGPGTVIGSCMAAYSFSQSLFPPANLTHLEDSSSYARKKRQEAVIWLKSAVPVIGLPLAFYTT